MMTDSIPRQAERRRAYMASDALRSLDLPPAEALITRAREIETAMDEARRSEIEGACCAFASAIAMHFGVASPPVEVLGVRPHKTDGGRCVYEKFGDYTFATTRIRLWMRTAIQHKVTSYGCLLSTLTHEVCHHLDVVRLGFKQTPHTRGFYERAAVLYHHARGTPVRPLVWAPLANGLYQIDWGKTMRVGKNEKTVRPGPDRRESAGPERKQKAEPGRRGVRPGS